MPNSDESKITWFVSGLRRKIQDVVEVYEYSSLKKLVHLHQGGITNFKENNFQTYS